MSSNRHPSLDDFLDGRTSQNDHRRIEEHLAGCEQCRAELERLRATRMLLRRFGEADPVPDELSARVSLALDRETGGRRILPFRRRWVIAAGVATAAVALIALVLLREPTRDFPTAAARDLESVAAATLPLELHTFNPVEMERWFATRVDFPTRVFDFAMMRYHLIGGRVDSIDGRRTALFAYRHENGAMVVCQMYPGQTEELPGGSEQRLHNGIEFFIYQRDGTTAVFWQEGSIVCVLTSAVPREEAISLAFAKAMKPA